MKKKWVYILVSVVVAVILITGGLIFYFSSTNYVAKVGNEKVTKAEYNYLLNEIKYSMEQSANLTDDTQKKAFWASKIDGENAVDVLKDKALEEAKKLKIQLILAKENNISLTKDEADSVKSSIDQQISQLGGKAEADKQLRDYYGITAEQLQQLAPQMMLAYNKFPQEMVNKGLASDDELKKYYDENKDSFDKVTVRHVLLSTVDENNNPLPADQQEQAKKTADEVYAKLKSGTDIGELAKQYSQDPGSKDSNGEYTITKGQMVKEFEDWSFSAKQGDTGIVKTDYGYHVMQLMKIYTYDELKDDVKLGYYYKKLDDWSKEDKYNMIKNSKVLDSITVPGAA